MHCARRVHDVMHDPGAFSSETGGDRPYGGTTLNDLPVAGLMLNMMDDPRHQRVRLLVSKGLDTAHDRPARSRAPSPHRACSSTPRSQRGDCDFVNDIAGELPMQAICILMGIPEADRHQLFEWIEHTFDFKGSARRSRPPTTSRRPRPRCSSTAPRVDRRKARAPSRRHALDRVSTRASTGEDPPELTDQELQFFFSLLWAAGADTTRNAIAGAVVALSQFPDQLATAPRMTGRSCRPAIEEIVRWTHPAVVQPPHRDARRRARGEHVSRRRQGRVLGGVGEPRRARVRRAVPLRRRRAIRIRIWASATACTTVSARTSRASRSESCSTSCSIVCETIELGGRSSGRAATSTRAFVIYQFVWFRRSSDAPCSGADNCTSPVSFARKIGYSYSVCPAGSARRCCGWPSSSRPASCSRSCGRCITRHAPRHSR